VLDVGWWISLFAYKPLPSARSRVEKEKKKDRASYRHYDLHPRICVQETEWDRTNKRRKLTSCYHPIRKGAGVAPANNAQAINIFCFGRFFFCSVGFSSRYVFLLTQLRNCVKRYAYTNHLVFPIRWERNEKSNMKTTATQTHQFWRPFSFSPRKKEN
jgi:hypothetical protein